MWLYLTAEQCSYLVASSSSLLPLFCCGAGRPSSGVDAATAGKLKSLLGCIADWALKSCPLALGSFTGQAGKDGGGEAGPDAAHQQPGPELRGGLRAVLKVRCSVCQVCVSLAKRPVACTKHPILFQTGR